jgi:hypothetical protein
MDRPQIAWKGQDRWANTSFHCPGALCLASRRHQSLDHAVECKLGGPVGTIGPSGSFPIRLIWRNWRPESAGPPVRASSYRSMVAGPRSGRPRGGRGAHRRRRRDVAERTRMILCSKSIMDRSLSAAFGANCAAERTRSGEPWPSRSRSPGPAFARYDVWRRNTDFNALSRPSGERQFTGRGASRRAFPHGAWERVQTLLCQCVKSKTYVVFTGRESTYPLHWKLFLSKQTQSSLFFHN